VALTFLQRFLGLMGKADLTKAFLLIPRCGSVHTFFMRGAIDIAFLGSDRRVISVHHQVPPWTLLSGGAGSQDTLELPPGYLVSKRIEAGDVIECRQN